MWAVRLDKMSLFKLFLIFVKIGAILLGGGYVILPILQNEFVDKRQLISNDELLDYFALSQSLPGFIAANTSMFIGYKLRGKWGALASMLGIILVPVILIILLASILSFFTENPIVKNVFWGVGIAVVALILLTVREIWQNSNKDWFFYLILISALCLLIIFNFSPINVIILVSLFGLIIKILQRMGVKTK